MRYLPPVPASDADSGKAMLRASDAEREAAADRLRDHCAAGRLTPDELTQRLDLVYAAKTSSQLQTLFADLPTPPTDPSRLHVTWPAPRLVAVPLLSAGAAVAATTDPHLLWLAWPALAIAGRHRRFPRKWSRAH